MSEDTTIFTVVGFASPIGFAFLLLLVDSIYQADCEALVYFKPVRSKPFAASAYAQAEAQAQAGLIPSDQIV
jgi:hypothetical protein